MLGLLVFPQKEWFDKIPEIKISYLVKEGWPGFKPMKEVVKSEDY